MDGAAIGAVELVETQKSKEIKRVRGVTCELSMFYTNCLLLFIKQSELPSVLIEHRLQDQ